MSSKRPGCLAAFPNGRYNKVARTFRLGGEPSPGPSHKGTETSKSFVAVISAGTGDLPVAEEARETLDWMGVSVAMIHDVGVAGPHRLPARLADFEHAAAIVVVAGMEGASAERRGRIRRLPGDWGADEYRLRREFRRRLGVALDAQ